MNLLHFIVGDIHGCIDEFVALESKIQRFANTEGRPYKIVSVGDLVDRGPDSKSVVQRFIDGERLGTHQAVMGNHESNFLRYLKEQHSTWFKGNRLSLPHHMYTANELYRLSRWSKGFTRSELPILVKGFWLAQGGVETLKSYGVELPRPSYKKLDSSHIRYLSKLPLFYETKEFVVSHALVRKRDLIRVKNYLNGKTELDLSVKKACNDIYWNRQMSGVEKLGNKKLISGHTPQKRPKRLQDGTVVQIDTHCYKGGRLTAFCPELDRFFSVKAQKVYYGGLG